MPKLDGGRVRYYRQQRGLSQEEVAQHLHYGSNRAISYWEKRGVKVSWEVADALAKLLNVPVENLLR